MAAGRVRTVAVRITADIEGFQKNMNALQNSTKTIQKQMELFALKNNLSGDSSKVAANQLESLRNVQSKMSQEMNLLIGNMTKQVELYGEDSSQAEKYRNKILDLQIAQEKLSQEIAAASNPLRNYKTDMEKLDKQLDLNKKSMELWALKNNIGANSLKMLSKESKENAATQKMLATQISLTKQKLTEIIATKGADSAAANELKSKLLDLQIAQAKLNKEVGGGLTKLQNFKNYAGAAADKMKAFGSSMMSMGRTMSMYVTAPIVAAATALVALTDKAGQFADDILTMSQVTGISTDKLQELRLIASQINMPFETIATSMGKFTAKMVEAQKPTSDTAKLMSALFGKEWSTEKLKPINEIFFDTIKVLGNFSDETLQSEAANKIFGRSFQDLLPLLRTTQKDYDALIKKFYERGLIFTEEQLRNMKTMGDEIALMKKDLEIRAYTFIERLIQNGTLKRLADIFENKVLPALEKVMEWIGKIADDFAKLSPERQEGLLKLVAFFALTGPLMVGLGGVFTIIGNIGGALLKLKLPAELLSGLGVIGAILGVGFLGADALAKDKAFNERIDTYAKKQIKNNAPLAEFQWSSNPVWPGSPEYNAVVKYYEDQAKTIAEAQEKLSDATAKPSFASPSGKRFDPILRKWVVIDTVEKSTNEKELQELLSGGGGAEYKPSTKQEALQKLFSSDKISLTKYYDSLLKLEQELYKGYKDKSPETLQKELQSTNEDIAKKAEGFLSLIKETADISKQMADGAKSSLDKLTDSLNSFGDAVKSKTSAFANFIGLFDVMERKPISGERLLNRLKGQLKAMGDWQGAMATLQSRGVPQQMLTEFQGMGVAGVENISALSKLSDEKLQEYVGLYNQKYNIAGSEALKQVTAEKNIQTNIEKQQNLYLNGLKLVPPDDKLYEGFTNYLKRNGVFAW